MSSGGIEQKIKHLYEQNRREFGEFSYTIPSIHTYPYQWLWDSCYMAIVMTYFDIEQAKKELLSVVSKQFENGMLPHIIYWQHGNVPEHLKIAWGKRQTSSITQPPLLAIAVAKVYDVSGDIEFVRQILPHIHEFHQFFYRHRDPRKSGLVGIINPDESGEDTSPRFDEALELGPTWSLAENYAARMKLVKDWREARFVVKQRMDLKHWVRDVPFNAVLLESLSQTARLASLAGEGRMAEWSLHHFEKTSEAMREKLKDENGLYYSTMDWGEEESKIDIRTWALFTPMFCGLSTHEEAERLVSLLDEPDFFSTPYGVPTVSVDEPSFDLENTWPWPNWRGPVWMGANWIVVKGLRRYGYDEKADDIKRQSMELIEKSGFREFYNPLSGDGYGAEGFTWGGLVLDM